MNVFEQILAWVNDPMIKTVLLFVGGILLKQWPTFINKAIPLALLAASAFISILAALFPSIVPAAHAAVADSVAAVTGAVQTSTPWWKYILTTVLVPVLVAVGTHSGVKNTRQFVRK